MFKNMFGFLKRFGKKEDTVKLAKKNKDEAKERLHLVLMQDRANVSADFMDLMRQEIIEVIKKYIDVNEDEIDVKLTNKQNSDGTTGSPALYANIPIKSIKRDLKMENIKAAKKVNSEKKLEDVAKKEEKVEAKEEKKEIKKEEPKSKLDEMKASLEKPTSKKATSKEDIKKQVEDKKEKKVAAKKTVAKKTAAKTETKKTVKKEVKKETKTTKTQTKKANTKKATK